jgi:hypothetical protein
MHGQNTGRGYRNRVNEKYSGIGDMDRILREVGIEYRKGFRNRVIIQ